MIQIIGAGAFGTALAISMGAVSPVFLWSRDASHRAEMRATHMNARRLPGVQMSDRVVVSDDVSDAASAILFAIPTQKLRTFCTENAGLIPSGVPLIACCKGIEISTGKRPTEILSEAFPNATVAILTGPSFADDLAHGLPTALTLACSDDLNAEPLQGLLTTPNLRIYRTNDIIGAELGGALKNVIAIACGAAIGAGLGDSARAALMTRGFAEMVRVSVGLGANPVTLNGLSGFGDLVLTCSSDQSRNYRLGLSLGRNELFPSSTTVEGVATARAMCELADDLKLDLPITRVVDALNSDGLKVPEAMAMLLSRPLKEETC